MVGSLTKEFPLADIDATIRLVRNGMQYNELREQAGERTHIDIPALITNRFLLVRNRVLIRDRFLSLAESEGLDTPRIRKIMYFTWAFRDHRLHEFILTRVCDKEGHWRPVSGQKVRKAVESTEAKFSKTTATKNPDQCGRSGTSDPGAP